MAMTHQPARSVIVDYVCDKCGLGHMRLLPIPGCFNEEGIQHACTACRDVKAFQNKYPHTACVATGEPPVLVDKG